MIVLQARDLTKAYGAVEILKSLTLAVNNRERIGLVGVNGSGKTTFLNCLCGLLEPDKGEVIKASSVSVAYLEQLASQEESMSAWDAVMQSFAGLLEMRARIKDLEDKISLGGPDIEKMMEKYALLVEDYERNNGYGCENTARRILVGLGFTTEEFSKPLSQFSGGQKTRIKLGRLLALSPELMLLDEPTNHLDMESVEWLEDYLQDYPGTLIVVSHDRRFLDRVATRIVELKNGRLKSFPGNYTAYLKLRAVEEEAERKAYEKQQEYINETEEYIRRFKAGIKSKQARGRETRLQRLERLDRPIDLPDVGDWRIPMEHESGNDVLRLRGISKSYGNLNLLHRVDMDIYKGEKIALIGPNGCGKTTLLKMITGELEPDEGDLHLGSRVKIAYFAQQYEGLDNSHTVLEELVYNFDLTLGEARTLLGGMLFREDEVFKKVGDLSGGEKGRLSILKMFLTGANFLILDEPTNHLDIESRQAVESMLEQFPGTVLLVSHDRYLIDRVATRVIAVESYGLQSYPGNYTYYCEKQQQLEKMGSTAASTELKKDSEQQRFRQEQKNEEKARRRMQRQLEEIEARIAELEEQKILLEEMMVNPEIYNQPDKARECVQEYETIKMTLEKAYEEWADLA